MRSQIEATRGEPGCVHYSYAVDVLDPQVLQIREIWTDQAALEAHFRAPHMAAFNQVFSEARVERLKVDAHQADHLKTLLDR